MRLTSPVTEVPREDTPTLLPLRVNCKWGASMLISSFLLRRVLAKAVPGVRALTAGELNSVRTRSLQEEGGPEPSSAGTTI